MKPENKPRFTAVRLLEYARFALAGGIAGISIYNTVMMAIAASPTQDMQSIAMGAGAVIATGIVKALHVV